MEQSIFLGMTALAFFSLGVIVAGVVYGITIKKLTAQRDVCNQNMQRLADEIRAQKKINSMLNQQIAELGLRRNKKGQFESVKKVKL